MVFMNLVATSITGVMAGAMYDKAPPAFVVLVLASMLFALNSVVIRDGQHGVSND